MKKGALTKKDRRVIRNAERHGIHNAELTYRLLGQTKNRHNGLTFAVLCAVLMRETSGGLNIFGHDLTIYAGRGVVTKAKYLAYRALSRRTGKQQGVGPMQLTSRFLQDKADKMGGCWLPKNNLRVGIDYLNDLMHEHKTRHGGLTAYNGSNYYAHVVEASAQQWSRMLNA
jgi:hypothetical protein